MLIPFLAVLSLVVGMLLSPFSVYAATLVTVHPTIEVDLNTVGNSKSIEIDPGPVTNPTRQLGCYAIPSSANSAIPITLSTTGLNISQGSNLQMSVFADANCSGKVVANAQINNISITTYGCSMNAKNTLSCKATSPVSARLLSSKSQASSTTQKSQTPKSKPSSTSRK